MSGVTLKDRPLRWGILGSGLICQDFCDALSTLSKEKHIVQHVAARDCGRAEQFAERFSAVTFSGDYTKVVEDVNVDVVYIGTINTTHKDLSMLALNHKKAVLCEKPITMDGDELKEVLACAKKNNVFMMEAVWTRCFPLYHDILSKVNSSAYGEPCVLLATFGIQDLLKYYRISDPSYGGSVLSDIGIYLLTVADMFFSTYKVKDIKACGHVDERTGVDRCVGITITYEGNKIVQLMANGDYGLRNEMELICRNATVRVKALFYCPDEYVEEKDGVAKEFKFELPVVATNFQNSTGLRFEADHVRDCLLKKLVESPLVPHSVSTRIMGYIDEVRKQIGMK